MNTCDSTDTEKNLETLFTAMFAEQGYFEMQINDYHKEVVKCVLDAFLKFHLYEKHQSKQGGGGEQRGTI